MSDDRGKYDSLLNDPNEPYGFFGGAQGATPKYARNQGLITDDFVETMARLYIVPPGRQPAVDGALLPKEINRVPEHLRKAAARIYLNGYIDFILQGVQTALSEKSTVEENLTDGYVAYYFGQSPVVLGCSGVLINSLQDDQVVNMVELYEYVLRGSKLAEHNEVARLKFDSFIYTGTLSSLQFALQAENEMVCPFNFSFLVKKRQIIHSDLFRPVSLSPIEGDKILADSAGKFATPQRVTASTPPVTPTPPAEPEAPPSTPSAAERAAKYIKEKVFGRTSEDEGGSDLARAYENRTKDV